MDRRFIYVYEKNLTLGGCLPLPWGYIHVYEHNIQISSSLKPLGLLKPNFMWRSLVRGNETLYKRSRSHDQDGHHGF